MYMSTPTRIYAALAIAAAVMWMATREEDWFIAAVVTAGNASVHRRLDCR
jgi:hypothetical protein